MMEDIAFPNDWWEQFGIAWFELLAGFIDFFDL